MGKKKTIQNLRKSIHHSDDDSRVDGDAETGNRRDSVEEVIAQPQQQEEQEKVVGDRDEEREEENGNGDGDGERNADGEKKRKRVRKRKSSSVINEQEEKKMDEQLPAMKKINSAGQTPNEESRFTNNCTIYIEGLPFDATESQITSFFASCGRISSIRLPRWHDSGRLRGYGHVEFENSESADKALELDGHYMGKRFLKIDRPMVPRLLQEKSKENNSQTTRPPGCRTIFIKNLPYDCQEQDLIAAFMFCGKIANVRLAVWNHTNQLKGFGYIEFKSEQSTEIAVKKSLSPEGIVVKGRPTICDYETGQPKGSFKPRQDPSKDHKGSNKTSKGTQQQQQQQQQGGGGGRGEGADEEEEG